MKYFKLHVKNHKGWVKIEEKKEEEDEVEENGSGNTLCNRRLMFKQNEWNMCSIIIHRVETV